MQTLLQGIKENKSIENTINKDLNAQQESFKKKLQEKRNKKLLSTSDCTEAIETVVSLVI